jgi:hypothetical protein
VDATRRSARGARTTALWCAVCAVLSATTAAADATASLDVGAERSDNIARSATNEQSETTATARGALAMAVERPRLKGDIDADLRYRTYLDDSFDDELVGGANVDLTLALIRERFDWIVQDNFGQISQDRRAVETPDNRQNVNVFSTGPSITLPLGARTDLNVDGRWTDAHYEDSVQNSESREASIGLARKLSEQSVLSLYGSGSETEYEGDPLSQTFRIKSAYLRFETSGARTTLAVDGGYTEVTHGDASNSGPLAHLTITRKVGAYSTLSLTAGTEFQDAAAQFRLDQAQIGLQDSNQDTVVAADVFRSNFVYLSFGTQRDRTSFNISLNGAKERHEEQTNLDRDILRATAFVSRRATQRLDVDLHGDYQDEDFVGPPSFAFKEWSFGVGVGLRLSPDLSMRLALDRYEGSSDDNSRDYEENRAYIGFGYTVGRR